MSWSDSAEEAVAGGLAALAGQALGGPAGAAAAATAAPLAVRALSRFLETVIPMKWDNAGAMVDVASEASGLSADELVDAALRDPTRTLLLSAAIDAATRTATREKIIALGQVLAHGATDDATVDLDALVVDALRDLERPHIEVLRILNERLDRRPEQRRRFSQYQLAGRCVSYGLALAPVLQTLERHGLADQRAQDVIAAIKTGTVR